MLIIFGVSDRAAAEIATGVLQDMGLVSEEHRGMVIDKAKVRRERSKMRRSITENEKEEDRLIAVYFDGRKDDTGVKKAVDGKIYLNMIKEEDFVLKSQPSGQYLNHVTPSSGRAEDVSEAI